MQVSSPVKKFFKQVGNIVAVQAVAGVVTDLGKKYMPGIRRRVNTLLDKADELNRQKNSNKDLSDLVKNTAEHLKETKKTAEAPPPNPESTTDSNPKP